MTQDRPNIFSYHDYRDFLKAWFKYLSKADKSFSMRSLASKSNLSSAYLPFVLSGKRKLSTKSIEKLSPNLGLTRSEIEYLELLRSLSDSESQQAKLETLKKMQGIKSYRYLNPEETEAYRYLTEWYFVAIRELALLPDFKLDNQWIADKLKNRISPAQAGAAIHFLFQNGYWIKDNLGRVRQSEKNIECVGGVYTIALNHFHQEILQEGLLELESQQVKDRHILGYTLSYSKKNFDKVKAILEEATERISKIEKDEKKPDTVFHVSLFAFPLTSGKSSSPKGDSNE